MTHYIVTAQSLAGHTIYLTDDDKWSSHKHNAIRFNRTDALKELKKFQERSLQPSKYLIITEETYVDLPKGFGRD